ICTALTDKGTLAVHGGAGAALKTGFETSASPYAKRATIVEADNLFILSENMTVDNWNRMLDAYRTAVEKEHYDGVIFAHGTDTLGFSAALFSMILADTDVPVFFVSSNAPLSSLRANGARNFAAAVACICEGIAPNVYAAYENVSDRRMYLHLASRLMQCPNYSEDFQSVGMIDITDLCPEDTTVLLDVAAQYPPSARRAFVNSRGDWHLREAVLLLQPYVGLRYDVIDVKPFAAVLHGTYHSGTACAGEGDVYDVCSVRYLLDACAEADTAVYLSPSQPTGEVYDTVRVIAEHGDAQFLYGTTLEAAYAKLLIMYAVCEDADDIAAALAADWNFETIVKRGDGL
ncbi:MAG: asparaginase, partial [Clostridia bacterium]|nr:asparaginase [Clostridia bacterium]